MTDKPLTISPSTATHCPSSMLSQPMRRARHVDCRSLIASVMLYRTCGYRTTNSILHANFASEPVSHPLHLRFEKCSPPAACTSLPQDFHQDMAPQPPQLADFVAAAPTWRALHSVVVTRVSDPTTLTMVDVAALMQKIAQLATGAHTSLF